MRGRFGRAVALTLSAGACGLVILGVLGLSRSVSSQQARYGGWSRHETDSVSLPAQRAPLPAAELNLRKIPYRIVFESFRDTGEPGNWEIRIVNADGSNLRYLTNTPDIDEFYPKVSPDGGRICFEAEEGPDRYTTTHNVYLMNIDGTGRVKIADNARQPCWSADGLSIAYLKGEGGRYNNNSWSNRGLEIVNLRSNAVRPHPNTALRMLFNLGWSPDGQWFVATSRGGGRENVAFKAGDTTLVPLSIHGCRPDISPDGKRIAWGRTDWDLDIGTLDLRAPSDNVTSTRAVVACERGFKVYHADWSPDGNYLAFSYGPSRGDQAVGRKAPGWNICVSDLVSGKWTQITSDGFNNKEPDWVPAR